jgi:hypothetical protein
MTLSVSTLLLFILISPGFLFRFYLNHKSIVKRIRVASDALHSGVLLLIYALIIHTVSILSLWILYKIYRLFRVRPEILVEYKDDFIITIDGVVEDIYPFIFNHYFYSIIYLIYTVVVVYLVVFILVFLSKKLAPIARLLYGPLYELVMKGPDFLTAFILTNISHNGKLLMYSGYAKEVGIKDGAKIDYIVLDTPIKFYLSLAAKEPKTTLQNARQIDGLLFLDCEKIENVHFQGWELD